MKSEINPGQDEVAGLNKWGTDQCQGGGEEPDDQEGRVGGLGCVRQREQASWRAAGSSCGIALLRWGRIPGTRRFGAVLRCGAQSLYGEPGTGNVRRSGGVANPPLITE